MKKFKIVYLFIFLFVLIGCSSNTNIEIFRFVNHENTIQLGEKINLQLIMGEYPEDANVKYSFSEEGVIEFTNGVAEGKKVGEVVVTATVDNVKFASTKVIVTREPVDGLQILAEKVGADESDNTDENTIYVDQSFKLSAKIYPDHFSNEVTWSIELGSDVAVITEEGELIPQRGENGIKEFNEGGALVRVVATSKEDSSFTAKRDFRIKYRETTLVTITGEPTEIALEDIESGEVESLKLTIGILPEKANNKVTVKSSDETIALVKLEGSHVIVTFPENPKAGTVVITVTSIDDVEGEIEITITEPETPEEPEENPGTEE